MAEEPFVGGAGQIGWKWLSTTTSTWIQASSGGSYAFGIYSPILKSTQSYSQSTLDTVSVFKDIGANAGVLSGLLYSSTSSSSSTSHPPTAATTHPPTGLWRRWKGPWVVHLAGAVQCFLGYFLMWLSVVGVIRQPPVIAVCLFMFLAAHAQTFFNTANVVTAVENFPDYGGTAVGIMKGYLGLSGAMLIQVYDTFLKGNPSTFILMLALLPTTVSLTLMCFVRVYPTLAHTDKRRLNGLYAVALSIAAYLTVVIVLENVFSSTFPFWAHLVVFFLLMALVLSPLEIVVFRPHRRRRQAAEEIDHRQSSVSSYSTTDPLVRRLDEDEDEGVSDIETIRSLNVLQAIATLEFWLLFVAMACGLGSGLATVNNLSQIGESLGYTTVEINTLVSLYSIWNCLGRFGAGFLSDTFLHRRGWPRPIFMSITLAAMAVGHLVLASGFSGNLYAGTVIVGLCYGSQWSLMPTITSEVFGVLHMGTIFNTIAIASPVGSYVLSVRVIGYIYDAEAGDSGSCSGVHCFMLSFFILGSVCLLGSVLALVLFFRTREFYSSVVVKRLRRFQRM